MSNEELAVMIQEGKTEYYSQLWTQNEKLLYLYLHRFKHNSQERIDSYGLTDEDIIQELYFALLKAVESFDSKKEYKFTTYLHYHVLNTFRALVGAHKKTDLLNISASLDNLVSDSPEDGTFIDLIADESAEEEFCKLEESICNEDVREILDEAMQNYLSPAELKRIREYFFNNKTIQKISEEENCSHSAVSYSIKNGLNKIKRSPEGERLRSFCDIDLYDGNGYEAFRNRGCSTVEMATEYRLKGKSVQQKPQ